MLIAPNVNAVTETIQKIASIHRWQGQKWQNKCKAEQQQECRQHDLGKR